MTKPHNPLLPAWLAEEAEEKHLSLSKFLQDGLKEKFGY
jgi:hypothetical protein